MKLFLSYLRMHTKAILLVCIAAVIFSIVFALYDLPLAAVGYAVLLTFCVGLVFTFVDYLLFREKHFALQSLAKRIVYSLDGLPPAKSLMEEDYQTVITSLYRCTASLTTQYDRSRVEMVDYYTLWAHQIKTPIAAMRILLQTDESEERSALQDSLFKIEEYVEMVLSYLRLDSDTSDFVLKHYPLDSIVRQAVRKYAPLFIRQKITLYYQPLDYSVLTDEKWLLFVIEQVLSNALKYTRTGGSVEIYLENGSTLVIADTGIGIAPEDLPRVGQKGFTGYNGRTDKKSTGIGLYLCRRILAKLSHTFVIESQVGRGTKVKIGLKSVHLTVE